MVWSVFREMSERSRIGGLRPTRGSHVVATGQFVCMWLFANNTRSLTERGYCTNKYTVIFMSQLNLYPLPHMPPLPPPEFFQDVKTLSEQSDTVAFNTGVENRDMFLGWRRCVICGDPNQATLRYCHIVGHPDKAIVCCMCSWIHMQNHLLSFQWSLLRQLGWAPAGVKASSEHKSRNSLLMCLNHCYGFEGLCFFIRFQPTVSFSLFCHCVAH